MQTGDCAGFGVQPNAAARRLLSRVLWVGGLAVAGSVFAAASASAAEADQVDESSGGLLGSLTSAGEPVTGIAGSLVAETDTLLNGELALTGELLGDDALLGDLVEEPIDSLAGTVGLDDQSDSAARERAAEREAATDAHTDRSMRREPIEEVESDEDAAEPTSGTAPERELASLIGSVDRLLTSVDVVPDVAAVTSELTDDVTTDVLGEGIVATSGEPTFRTQATSHPIGAIAGLVTLLDRPLAGEVNVLDPLTPLFAPLDPIARTAMPVAQTGPLAGAEQRWTARTPATVSVPRNTLNTSADAAPGNSFDESGVTRPAGKDGESAVTLSSLGAGTDGQDPSDDTRGGMRPGLLVTPVAGLTALHVGAPGAATSVDQAGPSSHALLPEEAVLRARLFSAAAYARSVEVKPLREANDPPVSPD